ncbi:MAG: DUF2252 domain-containing protein [Microthrixaceae bacterium]
MDMDELLSEALAGGPGRAASGPPSLDPDPADPDPVDTTPAERIAQGEKVRKAVPREVLGQWQAPADRPDPVEQLVEQSRTRVPELVPVRYGRMAVSAFTYLRGSPVVMARDLGTAPSTPLRTQLCGDAHLSNFGSYGTPERNLVFDLNDFDETLPGPFEWDVKRLVTSFVIAGRTSGQGDAAGRAAARAAATAYRRTIRRLADADVMDIWYEHIVLDDAMGAFAGIVSPKRLAKSLEKTRHRTSAQVLTKLTEIIDGERRIRHQPPLLIPLDAPEWHDIAKEVLARYVTSMGPEHRQLLRRFREVDLAIKVVGVGSVGTRCLISLLHGRDEDDVLFLQVKEAERSVLAPYAGESEFEQQGERVVVGQRLMQAASDVFLGWTVGPAGRHYYIRQLRDMKGSVDVDRLPADGLVVYGELCGRTLARAHARAADAIAISGYLGKAERFDDAMEDFAVAYGAQVEADFERFSEAVRSGEIPAEHGL